MSDLPAGWAGATLGDLGEWSSGGTPSRRVSTYFSGVIPWVKTGDLNHQIIDRVQETITETGLARSAAKLFPPGTLLVAMYGATIGQTGVLSFEAATNQACAALLANGTTSEIVPYVWRYLIAEQENLKSIGQGGAQPNISQTILKEYTIKIAPLPEQLRIVAKIDNLSAKSKRSRDRLDHVLRLANKYKQSILTAAFRGELTRNWRLLHHDEATVEPVLNDIRKAHHAEYLPIAKSEQIFELPPSWAWTVAEEIVEPGCDIVYGIVQPGPKLASGVPYVRGTDIESGRIKIDQLLFTSEKIAEKYARASLRGGDVLLGIIRATKVAIVPDELTGANITQGTARFRPSSAIKTKFLARWLESAQAQNWLHSKYRGIDMPGLNLRDVRRLPVPLAPADEQREIIICIDTAFDWIDRLASEATSARKLIDHLDQAVLAKAFQGELVPQNPSDEPASVLLERIRAERAATGSAGRNTKQGSLETMVKSPQEKHRRSR